MNLHEDFLISFFTKLNEMDVNYCVIHSYTQLPSFTDGDIDIAISYSSKLELESIIKTTCRELNWRVTQRLWYDVPECYYYVISSLKDRAVTLKIDLLFDDHGIGYTGYSSKFLTANPLMHKHIKHSSATAEFCYKLTKRIVKGYLKESDTDLLNELFNKSDKSIVSEELTRQYGKKYSCELLTLFNSTSGFTGSIPNRSKLYKAQIFRHNYSSLIRTSFIIKWQIQRIIHRLRYPCGAILLIPDNYFNKISDMSSMLSNASIDSFRVVVTSKKSTLSTRLKCLLTSTLLISSTDQLNGDTHLKLGILSEPVLITPNDSNFDIMTIIKTIDDQLCISLEQRMTPRLGS